MVMVGCDYNPGLSKLSWWTRKPAIGPMAPRSPWRIVTTCRKSELRMVCLEAVSVQKSGPACPLTCARIKVEPNL